MRGTGLPREWQPAHSILPPALLLVRQTGQIPEAGTMGGIRVGPTRTKAMRLLLQKKDKAEGT